MTRPSIPVLFCLLPVATLVAACSAQNPQSDKRYEDLRGIVLEHRDAIEQLRKEQEAVRAQVDQLQYGSRRAVGRPVYGPSGSADDSYWSRPTAPAGEQPAPAPGDPNAATPPPAEVASVPKPSPSSEPEKTTVPGELVGSSYDSAMRQLAGGDQDEAIQSFRNFLHENGSSPYADDAQFWIGEAYFRKGQYHRAIIEFNQVSINYGSGDRAPSALLRQAEAFRIVGDRVDARLSLQKVINRYPGTGEAAKASKMLSEIGG
jgi:tol-pal system protein YbgF